MTIVRCPRCRDEVSLPAKAPHSALVRCPLCHEKYLLGEAASQTPPELILVVNELEPTSPEQSTAEETAESDEYHLGGIRGGLIETQATLRTPVRLAPRPQRKEKNALVEIIKIVGGGVLGLALGLIVLWWGLRQDPLEMGPAVAGYAPWLVPQQFHARARSGSMKVIKTPSQISISPRKAAAESPRQATEDEKTSDALPGRDTAVPPALPAGKPAEEPRQSAVAEPKPAPAVEPMPDLTDLLPSGASAPTQPSPRD